MNKTIIAIVVVALAAVGGYFLFKGFSQSPTAPFIPSRQPVSQPPAAQAPVTQTTPSAEQNVVTYTDSGYSPSTLRVKTGATVTFKNESSRAMWTASAVHPSHAVYGGTSLGEHCPDAAGTAFDACAGIQPGNSWSFTFMKKGAWKYHNHLSPGDTGTIVVE